MISSLSSALSSKSRRKSKRNHRKKGTSQSTSLNHHSTEALTSSSRTLLASNCNDANDAKHNKYQRYNMSRDTNEAAAFSRNSSRLRSHILPSTHRSNATDYRSDGGSTCVSIESFDSGNKDQDEFFITNIFKMQRDELKS